MLEIVVVLAILGAMAALVAPRLAAPDDGGARRVARELAALVASARTTAAVRGRPVTLVLDPVDGRLWVDAGDDAGWREAGRLALGRDVSLVSPSPRPRIAISPTGTAAGDPIEIREAGRRLTLRTDPWTGAPRVETR